MSYMLEFPPTLPLPAGARSPPYVLFGIKDIDYFHELPSKIPLALVLHLAPTLRQHILPTPDLSTSATYLALRTPYVGINILADIDIIGLRWIITRMLQVGGVPIDRGAFLTKPSILSSISIHKAWMALGLPPAGTQGLHVHLQTELALGDAVSIKEMQAIWATFPNTSPIVLEMGLNFVRSHINFRYAHGEFSAMRKWFLATWDRCNFFRSLESRFPEFAQVQTTIVKAASKRVNAKNGTVIPQRVRRNDVMERAKTWNKKNEEHKKPERRESSAARRRMERMKSDDSLSSVETAIWDPPAGMSTSDPPSPMDNTSFPREMLEDVAAAVLAGGASSKDIPPTSTGITDGGIETTTGAIKLRIKRRKTKAEDCEVEDEVYYEAKEQDENMEYIHPFY